jgi:hypothetical protein
MKKRVMVWGERVEIEVYKSSAAVWIAKRSTPGAAIKAWRETASYLGN